MNLVASTLMKRRIGKPRQTPRDLGLADAGRPDHQNVLGHHLFAHGSPSSCLRRQRLRSAIATARLASILADDVAVEFGNDLAGRKIGHRSTLVTFDQAGTGTRSRTGSGTIYENGARNGRQATKERAPRRANDDKGRATGIEHSPAMAPLSARCMRA